MELKSNMNPGSEEPVTEQDFVNMSDASLVVAVGRWNEQALREIYVRHGGAVFALAKRVTRDPALAEEITQEIFVRLWKEPERFDPQRGSLRTYLLMQTHRRSVDLVRSEQARRDREEREAQLDPSRITGLSNELADLADQLAVQDALAELPREEREAIELAYFEGLTYKEVARRLEQPEGTIKTRIRTGLRRMNEKMAKWKTVEQ
jgi:RNA polymerase sigma-70 factor (ECF subfamily)